MEVSSGVAQENYWKERMEISPAYIGIWGYYQEYRYDETDNTTATTPPASPPTKEGLRWIVIQNGILFWYIDDIISDAEGFLSLSSSEITTGNQINENNENNYQIIIINKKKFKKIFLSFQKFNEIFLQTILQINCNIPHTTSNLTIPSLLYDEMNLSYQSLDELQLGIMQINIKDTRHVIEIYTTDDAHLIAEEFVQKNKLKLNSLIRIELELLHTQLDTCHIYQSKLKQYISYLRRTVISTSDAETQLLFHQYNYYDLLLNIYQFYSNIENNIQKYRNYFHKKIEKLIKKNEILTDMFHQSLNKCKEYHEKEKLLIFHCYELEEKLNRAIDIISNSCHTREYSQDPTTAIPSLPPGGGDYSSTTTTTTTIPSSSNDIIIQSLSNKSSTNPDLSIKIEKLAEETSDIYTMTLDTMRANYEQKLQQYEIQHNTDQQMILMLQNENNQIKLQLEKYQQQQQQQVSSTTPTSSAINSTNNNEKNLSLHEQQNIILREQFKNLQNSYNNLKLSLQQSTSKNELLTLQIHNISKRSSDQEDENKELRNQLNDLIKSIQVHNIHRLEDENRNLNEQVVTLRGEILRLQNEIHEIQEKAIQAVHVVQLLDKENNNNTPTPTPGATLVKKQSRSQSMNLTEQLSDPIHSQNHLKNEIIDGDITVELSIEPDDDHEDGEDHHEHEQEHEQEEGKKENQQIQDIQEIYTEAEVDLMLQQSIINIKLEEKSIASLSPVVEDRLLRNIYNKYALETTGDLTLSRFGRFTKEFKIVGNISNENTHQQHGPMLVYGDIDVVFVTTLKRIPPDEKSELSTSSSSSSVPVPAPTSNSTTTPKKASHAFIPPGKVHSSDPPSHSKILNTHMTINQFFAAIQELAIRLYSKVIEHKTGTVLECLPPQQKDRAIRAALDVFILKKIIPTANELGLIPWELMVLDQCLTTIHSSNLVSTSLVNHIHLFLSWFNHYSTSLQISQSTTQHEEKLMTSNSSQYLSPNPKLTSPLPSSSSYRSRYYPNTTHTSSPHPSHQPQPVIHHFKGITYKQISKFYHDYGIIPYLLKEPQLYNLFKEIFHWARSNIELLLIALPDNIRTLPLVQQELQFTSLLKQKYPKKQIIGLGSFFILFCTIATQVFKELSLEKRVNRLFQWTAQSGGSYLMQQKYSL